MVVPACSTVASREHVQPGGHAAAGRQALEPQHPVAGGDDGVHHGGQLGRGQVLVEPRPGDVGHSEQRGAQHVGPLDVAVEERLGRSSGEPQLGPAVDLPHAGARGIADDWNLEIGHREPSTAGGDKLSGFPGAAVGALSRTLTW